MTTPHTDTIATIRRHARPLEPLPTDVPPRLEPLIGIRAVLFDIYGTMFISGCGDVGTMATDGRAEAVESAFEQVGLVLDSKPSRVVTLLDSVIRSHQEAVRAQGGDFPEVVITAVWEDVLASLSAGRKIDGAAERRVNINRLAVEYEMRANPVWPMPHLLVCLKQLCRSKRLLGVVSNAQAFTPLLFPALLDSSLAELGFDEQLTYFSYEHGCAKPGERLFASACLELDKRGVQPNEVVYVGNDMLNDVAAAAGVGMRTALFAGDARSLRLREDVPRVQSVKPDIVLTDLAQLIACLPPITA